MSSSSGYRITVTILFVLLGLPPGLCSFYFAPSTMMMLGAANPEARFYGQLFAVPCLIGFMIFGILLWWLIRTWRQAAP